MTQAFRSPKTKPVELSIVKEKLKEIDIDRLLTFFKLFSVKTRLEILLALFESTLCVCDLSSVIDTTVSNVSHQLKVLKDGGFVKSFRKGKHIFYSLEKEHAEPILLMTLNHLEEMNVPDEESN